MDKACETSRCLTEAEEVYYAGHVVECAVETAENARFDFLAFVLQTTAINSAPHEVKITVCDSVVDRASCSCKAGYDYLITGGCWAETLICSKYKYLDRRLTSESAVLHYVTGTVNLFDL